MLDTMAYRFAEAIAFGRIKLEMQAGVARTSRNIKSCGTAGGREHLSEIDPLTSALLCRSVARAYAVTTVRDVCGTISTNQLLERSDRDGWVDITVNAKARNQDQMRATRSRRESKRILTLAAWLWYSERDSNGRDLGVLRMRGDSDRVPWSSARI